MGRWAPPMSSYQTGGGPARDRPSAGRPLDRARGGGGDLRPRALAPLAPRGEPADGAGNREQDGKHLDREAHRLVHDAGVEIDVGIELVLDEVVVLKGG